MAMLRDRSHEFLRERLRVGRRARSDHTSPDLRDVADGGVL